MKSETRKAVSWALAGLLTGGFGASALPEEWILLPPTARDDGRAQTWACPMQCVILDGPGVCPVCGMELEPIAEGSASLALDEHQQSLVGLALAPVERRPLERTIRSFGRIALDERRQVTVSAWVGGRIERLYANNTYADIRKGDHVYRLYSPELAAAQREWLVNRGGSLANASRERLLQLGVSPVQLDDLMQSEEPLPELDISTPISGKVTSLLVKQGQWVERGDPLFTVADYSSVWLRFSIYEEDLTWIAPGQRVSARLDAWPSEVFTGILAFVEPNVGEESQTVMVRAVFPNEQGRLFPGMQALVDIHAAIGSEGRLVPPPATGDYACYMHPEAHADTPALCPECGMEMALVVAPPVASPPAPPVLAVLRSAVLDTGERAVVYVARRRSDGHVELEMRDVFVGPVAGDYVQVLSGLEKGELVATRGAMLVDSQMELTGRPSVFWVHGRGAKGGARP